MAIAYMTNILAFIVSPLFPFVTNGLIGLILLIVFFYKKSAPDFLFGIALFSCLFFAYSSVPLFIDGIPNSYLWYSTHPHRLSLVVIVFFGVATWRIMTTIDKSALLFAILRYPFNILIGLFCIWITTVIGNLVWYSLSIGEIYLTLAVKGIVVMSYMFFLSFILGFLIFQCPTEKWLRKGWFLTGFVFIAVSFGFYEILTTSAWVANTNDFGMLELRASSFFLNPNFFGIWCMFLTVAATYLVISGNRLIGYVILLFTALGIFLSGSRSASILTFFFLVSITILLKKTDMPKRKIFEPIIIFSSFFVLYIFLAINSHNYFAINCSDVHDALKSLAIRQIDVPQKMLHFFAGEGDNSFRMSIEGRMASNGGRVDNAYIAIVEDGGIWWCSLGALVIIWIFLVCCVIRLFCRYPTLNGAWVLSVLLCCIATGFVMQSYQAFPVCMFIVLTLSFVWAYLFQGMSSQDYLIK